MHTNRSRGVSARTINDLCFEEFRMIFLEFFINRNIDDSYSVEYKMLSVFTGSTIWMLIDTVH